MSLEVTTTLRPEWHRSLRQQIWLSRRVLALVDRSQHMVDYLAGEGRMALLVRSCGINITAVEPSLRHRSDLCRQGVVTYSEAWMLSDGKADAVYSIDGIDSNDAVDALWAMHAKMKSEGRLFLCLSALAAGGSRHALAKGSLAELVELAGFRVNECRYVDVVGWAAWRARQCGSDPLDGLDGPSKLELLFDRLPAPLCHLLDRLLGRWFGKDLVLVATRIP